MRNDTTIRIKNSTRRRLDKIGKFGEGYNDLIVRMLNDRRRMIKKISRLIKNRRE